MKTWIEGNRKKITEGLFYLALTTELLLMILEKSEISFHQESHVFRVTFVLTLLAVLFMEHSKKEWIFIAAIWGFTFLCYYLSGKNDLLRVATFLMAARDIDLKKAMKYSFFVSLSGFLLIVLLSCAGILGSVSDVADYGRRVGEEVRYSFGFGHPNSLFSAMYVLVLMWIWIYGSKAGIIPYAVMSAASVLVAVLSKSRTGLAVLALTLAAAVICRIFPKLSGVRALYYLEMLFSPVLCALSAVAAAGISEYVYLVKGPQEVDGRFWTLEIALNFRISSIFYEAKDRDAVLGQWKLFAGRGADSYFDMGWVRIFYWYGILPAILILIAIAAVVYMCKKERDIWTLILIFSLSLYTIVEATFVTRYIGREFFLLIAGVYLGYYFTKKGDTDVRTA